MLSHKLIKRLMMIQMIVVGLLNSFYANSQTAEVVMAKVTIVVDGMMKSKSGAT